jgi:tRNA (guanine37-N1)-methyltransferase
MVFEVFSLFPEVMQVYLESSIMGRAVKGGLLHIHLHNIRDYAMDKHRTTDDEPYGGGGGMVMKPEPIFAAVEKVLEGAIHQTPVVLLSPQGRVLDMDLARTYAEKEKVALICGRYEGVDERVRRHLVTNEISIGDYVLTGGELPAMVFIDAVTRFIPGVLGDETATLEDSHSDGLLEYPHYTRPKTFRGWAVPEILRSGDHARIAAWRRELSLLRTYQRRPDLLERVELTADEELLVQEWKSKNSVNDRSIEETTTQDEQEA